MNEATADRSDLARFVRTVEDFPAPGVHFRDITPLLCSPEALRRTVSSLSEQIEANFGEVDVVLGMEARGFLLGPAVAIELGVGFVPVRKPGKLPHQTVSESYQLEYGTDRLEVHSDSLVAGQRGAIVDDVIATGGTASATERLVQRLGAEVAGFAFLIELSDLKGAERLSAPLVSLIRY